MSKIAGAKLFRISHETGYHGDDSRFIKAMRLDGAVVKALATMKFDGFTDVIVAIDRPNLSNNLAWVSTARNGCRFTSHINVPDEAWTTPHNIQSLHPDGSIFVIRDSFLHQVTDNKSMKFALETL